MGEEMIVEIGRREFLLVLGGMAMTRVSNAQQVRKIPKIGVLWHAANAEEEGPYFRALLQGFKDIGYVERRNIIFEHRFPNEAPERFKSMAAELVALNVDVLISVGTTGAPYAKNATTTIPVVFTLVADPVGSKLVDSLPRPGGNVTGLSTFAPDLIGKRLEFLRQLIPGLNRVGVLVNPNAAAISRLYIEVSQAAAAKLDLMVQAFEVRSLEEFGPAFDAMKKVGVQAVMNNSDGLMYQGRAIIAKLAIEHDLPLSAYSRETLEAGALMSYGADLIAIAQRTPVFVDKILKGAKPSELPVEQPTKVEFLINLKTAKALGIGMPAILLTQANEVIE
jgi:putative ABC transport system substrate-binding protein